MKEKLLKNNRISEAVNESGQMLLFTIIVLFLLLLIFFAIVVNVRVDIKETQLEREYEEGYSIGEEELLKITSDGFGTWVGGLTSTTKFCPTSGCNSRAYTCYEKSGLGENSLGEVVMKRCEHNEIFGMTVGQDETIEVDLTGASGTLSVGWSGAPAVSAMLVCRDSVTGDYSNTRMAVCRGVVASGGVCDESIGQAYSISGFESIATAKATGPFNLDMCTTEPVLLRLRAIGAAATDISVTSDNSNLPSQMEEIRVQSFSEGISNAEELSAPEVYTLAMINKRLPSLFDYVLFVSEGDVSK
ncbi:hypothetical protein ACFLY9_00175 [Patescibacteria group bacterium]